MIKTFIEEDDVIPFLDTCEMAHQESRYGNEPFNRQSFANYVYELNQNGFVNFVVEEGRVVAIFLGSIAVEPFSGKRVASEGGIYVIPEKRGSSLFIKMCKNFEAWGKSKGACKILLRLTSGIHKEKTTTLFSKMGYAPFGTIFDKEI